MLNEIERMKLHPESQICHCKQRKLRLMHTGKVLWKQYNIRNGGDKKQNIAECHYYKFIALSTRIKPKGQTDSSNLSKVRLLIRSLH